MCNVPINMLNNISRTLDKRFIFRLLNFNKRKYGTKTYEGEGKTTANIINNEPGAGVMINGYSHAGFRLNNDMTVLGPMVIFPRTVLAWTVSDANDINEESLSLFTIIEPKLDIIVIGTGNKIEDRSFFNRLLPFAQKHKLNFEILPTDQACSTFNFLNSEGRYVAGALIPPYHINYEDEDLLRTKLRYQNLYEID